MVGLTRSRAVLTDWLYRPQRRWYRQGRPHRLARVLNAAGARVFAAGRLAPRRAATLEVVGRRTGRTISVPVMIANYQGGRYLVSMLGDDANWVRNVCACAGRAVLRQGDREVVQLDEVDIERRAPVLRRYLEIAPGARPHLPVDRRASLAEFAGVAARFPVFRISTLR